MKYIDAEKLVAEIERQRVFFEYNGKTPDERAWRCLGELISFIDSLQQEQPEVDIEKEIDACWQNWLSPSNQKKVEGVLPKTEFAMYARHFAQWGAEHTPLPEDTVIFNKGIEEGKRLMMEGAMEGEVENAFLGIVYLRKNLVDEGYSAEDKVRIIIVKED